MKNNSTKSSSSSGDDSIIHPENLLHNLRKLFSDKSANHCEHAEYDKRNIVPECRDGKNKCDEHLLNDITKCKGLPKKGTRIFECLHPALNENSNYLSKCSHDLNNDFQVQSNKNNYKLQICRYTSDEFCPFGQKVLHKQTLNKDNHKDYLSEDKRRKYKQFPNKKDREVKTCYLRIPKKYLIKNQAITKKTISSNLDDNDEVYNIFIHKNSLPVQKEIEQKNMYHESRESDFKCRFPQNHKHHDLRSKLYKKYGSEHFKESIAVSYSTLKINYEIAPLLLMASTVSKQLLKTAIMNYVTFIMFGIFNKYQIKTSPQAANRLYYSEHSKIPLLNVSPNIKKNIQTVTDSGYRNRQYIIYSSIYEGENSKMRNGQKAPGELNIKQHSLQAHNNDEICPETLNSSLGITTNITDKFSKLLQQAYNATIQITNVGLNNYENCFRFGVYSKEEQKNNIVCDASVLCNLASETELEMMQLNALFFEGVKKEFMDISEISRKLKSSTSEILGALNNFNKIPKLSNEDHTENELHSNTMSQGTVVADFRKNVSSNKLYSKSTLPVTEIKFKSTKFIDNYVPLMHDNVSTPFTSPVIKLPENQDICETVNSQENEENINQNNDTDNKQHEESISEPEQKEQYNCIRNRFDSHNFDVCDTVNSQENEENINQNNDTDNKQHEESISEPEQKEKYNCIRNRFNSHNFDVCETVNSQENEENINQNNDTDNKQHEESISEPERKEKYNSIRNRFDIRNFDRETNHYHQLHGEFNNRQKNSRLRKWEYFYSKPTLLARTCFSEGSIFSRSLPLQDSQPNKILWCLTRVTSYVNGARTYEFIDKMQLASPNSIGDYTAEHVPEIPNMVVVMAHYDDSNESLVNHAPSSQNL